MTPERLRGAILKCDDVRDEYIQRYGGYPEMIEAMFAAIGANIDFDTFDCRQEQFPPKIARYDFFIITGSKHSVYENSSWIQATIELIKRIEAARIKLIGICFGHQLIAQAHGIAVEKSDKGWGLGLATNRMLSREPWMQNAPGELHLIVSHQDQITAIDSDAKLLASSAFCPFFFVQWSNHCLSIQGHPEWLNDYARERIRDRRELLSTEQVEKALASLDKEPDNALVARWMLDFIAAES